ncbi:hypothetical protein AAFF_G00263340 [Aldrovandia affinis]|uniref:Uncharacterized protein n=1 Tax=Aldrovandia affinis TaxID=143900 RepID=A0AAD7SSX8_9TELE|nr:hypothetical protein AAFF_G00263340 [Aldrovandia affinis]
MLPVEQRTQNTEPHGSYHFQAKLPMWDRSAGLCTRNKRLGLGALGPPTMNREPRATLQWLCPRSPLPSDCSIAALPSLLSQTQWELE